MPAHDQGRSLPPEQMNEAVYYLLSLNDDRAKRQRH